ncbi:uncharacterized protein LOC120328548 isoform X1 [Styela clava]
MKVSASTVLIASIAVLFASSVKSVKQRMICTVDEELSENENIDSASNTRLQGSPVKNACIVDYENTNATIREIMKSIKKEVIAKIKRKEGNKLRKALEEQRTGLNKTINKLLKRIEKLEENATAAQLSPRSIIPEVTEQDIVHYGGRKYIPWACQEVNRAAAIATCQQLGGELANIYNQNHLNKIMTFIRENKMGKKRFKKFSLGMTYDTVNQILNYRNGTSASDSGLRWWKGFPKYEGPQHIYTHVYVGIEDTLTNPYQYIINLNEQETYVLCEI